jgi:elongation factor 1-beta
LTSSLGVSHHATDEIRTYQQDADDYTNMDELKANVLSIEKDGLVWGASKLVTVGFGIKKLQLNLVIEDDKVSLDELQEQIEEFEDQVQSTVVVAIQDL